MENGQVELVLDQIVQSVFKGARLELILVVDHHHGVLIVVISLEAGHADHSSSVSSILPKLSRQRFFLQPGSRAGLEPRSGGKSVAVKPIVRASQAHMPNLFRPVRMRSWCVFTISPAVSCRLLTTSKNRFGFSSSHSEGTVCLSGLLVGNVLTAI